MAGPLYGVANLLIGSTVVAPSGTATGYLVASLYVGRPSKVWRSSTTAVEQRINIDLGSAKQASIMALFDHNLPVGALIKLEKSATGAWAGEQVHVGTFTVKAGEFYLAFLAASSRYWSLRLQDSDGAGGVFTTAPQIGELWLDDSTQLSRAFRWGYQRARQANTIEHQTPHLIRWMAKVTEPIDVFRLGWQTLNQSQLDELQTFHGASAGQAKPALVVPFPDVAAKATEVVMVAVGPGFSATDIHTANKHAGLVLHQLPYHVELT